MDICDSTLYIGTEKLSDYAASAARLCLPRGEGSAVLCLKALRRDYDTLRETDRELTARYADGAELPAACEWLLDNMYMVHREYRAAAEEFSRGGRLRCCGGGVMLTELCRSLVISGRGAVDTERCGVFLSGFESVTILRRGELSLFPAALKAALISALAEVCRRMRFSQELQHLAELTEALFSSLRLISGADMTEVLTAADITDAVLRRDPTGEYSRMDARTREAYLLRTERLARRAGTESHEYAARLIAEAEKRSLHVGFLLFPPKRDFSALYIGGCLLLTLTLSIYAGFVCSSAAAGLLLLLPVSELVKSAADALLLRCVRPRYLPRMDSSEGIDSRGRTVCVISALLTKPESAAQYAAALEELYHACRSEGEALCFGLLADLPSSDSEHDAADGGILRAAETEIRRLNRLHDGRFYLFTRPRHFDGESWSAHERKRGALTELAKLLCGREHELCVTGDADALGGIKYILTLDSDTRVRPSSVGELIAAALHPLNRPVIDREKGVVTQGHAIFHPRIGTELSGAYSSDFSIIFGGSFGCDPYSSLCGELYMDCFASGGFAGKGLIDAQALLICSAKNIPEKRVLSHDALEGAFLRGAFLGDTEFADSFPADAPGYYKRQHRWIRGDWQNAPWLFRRGRALRSIDRFRLFDSLRRSLLPPLTFAAMFIGLMLPLKGLTIAAAAALICLLRDILAALPEALRSRRGEGRLRRTTRLFSGLGGAIVRCFFRLWLLPYEACVSASAIVLALWRMCVSHRRLLQWQTAAQSAEKSRGLGAHIKAFLPVLPIGLLMMMFSPLVLGRAAGFMWLLSPAAAYALALPAYREQTLSSSQQEYLRRAAEDTWRYLSEFSSREDNYLPPDNYQQQPPNGIAHRTSPTNIGLALVSAVAACDLGIIEKSECISYVNNIMCTIKRMPLFMGHLCNWYDTKTLRPLSPVFISTVDSGNLCASLICVSRAMEEYGAADTAAQLRSFADGMSFSPLYDRQRGLFYICYDTENRRGAGGRYDLMASEARLTSYLAVARGDVPAKHWARLGRAQLRCDGYYGLASWTGTMFEYLMPELFLPLYRGSLLYETARFCLYAQRRRVYAGKPWGISESAYFALDGAMNYRYKASGAAALALRRGQDEDTVISPYSSFLALAVLPQAAIRNLHRIELMGGRGDYGFYEALDFTPRRCRSENGEIVRCYMAHHAGMSIISAANALCGRSIVRRFMADPAMRAYSLLLQERLPNDTCVIRRETSDVPERAERLSSGEWSRKGDCAGSESVLLLSNGVYSMRIFSDGRCSSMYGELEVYSGHAFIQKPLKFAFFEDRAEFEGLIDGVRCRERIYVSGSGSLEVHELELFPAKDGEAELTLPFSPVLARPADYAAHPAFWDLGIKHEAGENGAYFKRLSRGTLPDVYAHFLCSREVKCSFSGDRDSLLSLSLLLSPMRVEKLRFSIYCGFEPCRSVNAPALRGTMLGAAAALLGMTDSDLDYAMSLLPAILKNAVCAAAPKQQLWPYGISGDYPILVFDGADSQWRRTLRAQLLLKSCGVSFDLVLLSDEEGEYRSPLRKELSSLLGRFSLESLAGAAGGVHILPSQAAETVYSRSVLRRDGSSARLRLPPQYGNAPRRGEVIPEHCSVGNEFRFTLRSLPPKSWSHILTNGSFSCIVDESGCGGMFFENAREMQLTPFNSREHIYLERDKSRVSLFADNDGLSCSVRYAPGFAVWEKEIFSRRVRLTLFTAQDRAARIAVIEGAEGLTLHWQLPLKLGGSLQCVSTELRDGLFTAQNSESFLQDFRFAAAVSGNPRFESDFFPPALSATVVCGRSCVLVCGRDTDLLSTDLCKYNNAAHELRLVTDAWNRLTDAFILKSPCPELDFYMHPWALYQTFASRLYARAGYYQPGGAYGFRDQLQDAENLLLPFPGLLRERILDCCRHQYVEGDVMHWWHPHPDGDMGLRSRCSDDLLWLVRALCRYVEGSGDESLCFETAEFISSPLLRDGERDRFERAEPACSAYIIDHARSALELSIKRGFGQHGLPYIGSCDWNDGLDAVNGESVWLGWFMTDCLESFARLLQRLSLPHGERYLRLAAELRSACEGAWCRDHYARAYYPDGEVIGGEERVDSLTQSWAALCGADEKRVGIALDTALEKLVDRSRGIVKLFDPPFSDAERRPGYITGYGEGFRENGGQYTHAAIWLAQALFRTGRTDEGYELLLLLLPENHDLRRYKGEPFVLAADVYSAHGREGEAGWTWYTGSAGWYFRVVTEELLGIRLRDGKPVVSPALPSALPHYDAELRCGGELYRIRADSDGIRTEKLK